MLKKFIFYFKVAGIAVLMQLFAFHISAQSYFNVSEINQKLQELKKANPNIVAMHSLGKSAGVNNVQFVEIGKEVHSDSKSIPAIFIMANPHGNNPLSSYSAIKFIDKIIANEAYKTNTYFVLPVLNADALTSYFKGVKYENVRDFSTVNDDSDELTDEDGFDDLNGDGFITKMRVVHPGGSWIVDPNEPRLMKKADQSKGEKGMYKLYDEGIDNDGDGKYNEDPVGGINPGINFPFFHNPENKIAGQWPGCSELTFNLMKFVYEHPEIAMAFTFGETNTCLNAPKAERKGSADFTNIKIPKNMAEQFNLDASKTYTMDEIIEMFQPMVPPGMELTPNMVASFLGLGAVVNHLDDDIAFYNELADEYKEYLKENDYNLERLDAETAKDGSFELWMYFHYGVPSFSMNFFTIPKPEKKEENDNDKLTIDQLEKMSSEDFVALGEERIAAFLKANNAPPQFGAEQVIKMVEAGQINPERMAAMMKQMGASSGKNKDHGKSDEKELAMLEYSDNVLGGKGFVNWKKFQHPELGEVEIGGFVPYLKTTPILDSVKKDIDIQSDWVFEVVKKAPALQIADIKTKKLGNDIYQVEVWIENRAYLSFPIAMGNRNERPAPAILLIDNRDLEVLEGKKRTPVLTVKGLNTHKVEYLIKTKLSSLDFKLESKNAGNDQKQIKIN